jgi:hypothetical protein
LRFPSRKLRNIIDAAAAFVGLPEWTVGGETFAPSCWLEGLILAESGGDLTAMRYEPQLDWPIRPGADDADVPGRDDGVLEDDRSYGLMQVLGSNVRRMCGVAPGTAMDFSFALLPLPNLSFGLRVLIGNLAETKGDVGRALAKYNGGFSGDRTDAQGRMRCQAYVNRVAEHARLARDDRERSSK